MHDTKLAGAVCPVVRNGRMRNRRSGGVRGDGGDSVVGLIVYEKGRPQPPLMWVMKSYFALLMTYSTTPLISSSDSVAPPFGGMAFLPLVTLLISVSLP